MTRQRIDRPPDAARAKPKVEAETRRRLGQNLRLFYAGMLDQPLPHRFTRLLDDLSRQGAEAETGDGEGSR